AASVSGGGRRQSPGEPESARRWTGCASTSRRPRSRSQRGATAWTGPLSYRERDRMLTRGYLTVTVLLRVALLFAASVPLTDTMTFTLPLTSALLSVRRAFLLSLSVTLMVLPAPTRFEAFLITTTFFFLPLPLRIFAVIFSDAASLDLTLK